MIPKSRPGRRCIADWRNMPVGTWVEANGGLASHWSKELGPAKHFESRRIKGKTYVGRVK